MKPLGRFFRDMIYGERDSLKRPTDGVIIYLNINQGGSWTYNRDKDRYEDTKSERLNLSDEIKYRQ